MTGFKLKWKNREIDFAARPCVMGVVNVTPDSFSDGGDFLTFDEAVSQGLALVESGADMLDIGGESTRPGAMEASEQEELERVLPVIRTLVKRVSVPISIDTYKASVARAAVEAGASIINDIGAGLLDPEILKAAAELETPLILMHMKGRPRTMQADPQYDDLVSEVKGFLLDAATRAQAAGVPRDRIILDPGLGFGKTFDHNLTIVNRLREFKDLGFPLLMGPSRKAFLGRILNGAPAKERDIATQAIVALSLYNGADIVRVHNVALARQTANVTWAVMKEHV